jgi:hypothetical protein
LILMEIIVNMLTKWVKFSQHKKQRNTHAHTHTHEQTLTHQHTHTHTHKMSTKEKI